MFPKKIILSSKKNKKKLVGLYGQIGAKTLMYNCHYPSQLLTPNSLITLIIIWIINFTIKCFNMYNYS